MRILYFGVLVLVASQFGSFASPAKSAVFYALETENPNVVDNNIFLVDTDAIGSPIFIGSVSGGVLSELIYVDSDTLYTFDRTNNLLLTISTRDASVISSVPLDVPVSTVPRGYELSPSGVLYGVFDDPLTEYIRVIDPLTGNTSPFINLSIGGGQFVEAITFSDDGTIFAGGFSPSGAASLYESIWGRSLVGPQWQQQ